MAGLELQKTVYNILFMPSFEKKERFLDEFSLRLNNKIINKHWLLGSLGCGLFLEERGWGRLPRRAHRPRTHALPAPGGMLALPSKKVGPAPGTDQRLLALHSNHSASQGLNSPWREARQYDPVFTRQDWVTPLAKSRPSQ